MSTCALNLLSNYACDEGYLVRVELQIEVENLESSAVADRCGDTFESVIPKKDQRFGAYQDVAMYVLLVQDALSCI